MDAGSGPWRTVNVGLDFGTSSTKVLAWARGAPEACLYQWEPQMASGWLPFLIPSLVTVDAGGACWFGAEALAGRGPVQHTESALKMHLLDDANVDVDVLVSAYLAWVMQLVRDRLQRLYAGERLRVIVNVAAPMASLGEERLRARYERIVQAARDVALGEQGVGDLQGAHFDELSRVFQPRLDPSVPVEDERERRWQVLPETLAPLVSLARDPTMPRGRYLIVDVGAGTTEMSINVIEGSGADRQILCYYDESSVIGARVFRDANGAGRGDKSQVLESLAKRMQIVWEMGYRKDAGRHVLRAPWRELTVMLAGGGSLHPEVTKRLGEVQPLNRWGDDASVSLVFKPYAPTGIDFPDASKQQRKEIMAYRRMLAVAHGLSIPRPNWPVWKQPEEIIPVPQDQVVFDW